MLGKGPLLLRIELPQGMEAAVFKDALPYLLKKACMPAFAPVIFVSRRSFSRRISSSGSVPSSSMQRRGAGRGPASLRRRP